MRLYSILAVLMFGLLSCAGCGTAKVSLPGETPVYTISCDNSPDDCYVGAQTLCNGPYEFVTGILPGESRAAPGSFGWVDPSGQQQDIGGSGGRYSIRIRCR